MIQHLHPGASGVILWVMSLMLELKGDLFIRGSD